MKKDKRIFYKVNNNHPIIITQQILDNLKVGDWIFSQHNELVCETDHGNDPHFSFEIYREVEETKMEIIKRKKREERKMVVYKKNRYDTYLRLKKEFEG